MKEKTNYKFTAIFISMGLVIRVCCYLIIPTFIFAYWNIYGLIFKVGYFDSIYNEKAYLQDAIIFSIITIFYIAIIVACGITIGYFCKKYKEIKTI